MRFLLFFVFLFFYSYQIFAQSHTAEPAPKPQCTGLIGSPNVCGFSLALGAPILVQRTSDCTNAGNKLVSEGVCSEATQGRGTPTYKCWLSCTCAPPFVSTVVILNGASVTQCVDPSACPAGQVRYADLCRDAEDSPGDCGGTYDTAILVDGKYVCASGGCEAGSGTSVYTNANGSWSVCGSPDTSSSPQASSSGNASSSPTSTPSSDQSGSSSGTSSIGNSGGGGGGDDGDGGGGQDSSSGGDNNPPTQSASSNSSSANGWASSGSGAGNCDPTSYGYLECISRENAGEGGEGIGDINQEGYELDIQQRLQQARDKYTDKVNQIKDDLNEELSVNIGSGSGSLPHNRVTMYGTSVELGIAARQDFFDLIKWIFLAAASVLSLYIVLGK